MSALPQQDELQRLEALARYEILDTLPEEAFDRIANLAARLFGTPIALVSMVDENRQWFKACLGLDLRQTDRSLSFCAHAILSEGVMVVPDATRDPRFAGNALVTGEPNIRFYAGAPLITPDGHKLGTLCVIDDVPRAGLSPEEQTNLSDLAALVVDELELRRAQRDLENEARAKTQMVAELRRATEAAQLHVAMAEMMEYDLELSELVPAIGELLGRAASIHWLGLHLPSGDGQVTTYSWYDPSVPEAFTQRMTEVGIDATRGLHLRLQPDAPLFLDHAELGGQGSLNPALTETGVRSMAWFPLALMGGARALVTFARFADPVLWRPDDQRLLRSASRTLNVSVTRREQLRKLEVLAFVDSLTGLGNRRALERDLQARVSAGKAFALSLIDLGGLQAINEAEGYERGDVLLHLFGEALQTRLGDSGTAYRLSGDEFALLTASDRSASPHVEEALGLVRGAGFELSGVRTASVHSPENGTDAQALFSAAGTQLYDTRQTGGQEEPDPQLLPATAPGSPPPRGPPPCRSGP